MHECDLCSGWSIRGQCARCDCLTPVKQLECAASCYQGNGQNSVAYLCATLSGVLLAMLQISPYSTRSWHTMTYNDLSCDFCSGNEEMSQSHVEICGGTWFERRGLDMSTRKGLLDFWRRMTSRLARLPAAAVTHGGSSTGDPTWYKIVICSISCLIMQINQ